MTPEQLEKIRKLCDKNFKVGIFPKTISRDELLYLGGCAGGMIDLIDKQEKEIKRLEAHSATVLSHCDHLKMSIETLKDEIKRLKEEADLTDIFEALENAGINMGDNENPQDPITAIGILGDKIKRLEAEKAYWYEISGKQMQSVESQHSQICKQRTALKKLGRRYHILRDMLRDPDIDYRIAQNPEYVSEQLRAEGVIR